MIYLDYNATTPVLPEVLEAMMSYLTSEWGNPSSTYKFGSKLKTVIETVRAQVAELIVERMRWRLSSPRARRRATTQPFTRR
jgi:cysteine desulfurase